MKKLKLLTLGLTGLGLALLAWVLARPAPAPLTPVSLLAPNQIPPERRPLFARLVPATPSWGWAWRLREKVLGPGKPVTLDVVALRLGPLCGTSLAGLGAPDLVTADGLQVWRLGPEDLEALRQRLRATPDAELQYPSRITTGEDSAASISNGHSVPFQNAWADTGLFVTFRPRFRNEVTDVIASMRWLEAVTNNAGGQGQAAVAESISLQTNLEVIARLQLSNACGALILQPARRTGNTGRVGTLLWVTRPVTQRSSR